MQRRDRKGSRVESVPWWVHLFNSNYLVASPRPSPTVPSSSFSFFCYAAVSPVSGCPLWLFVSHTSPFWLPPLSSQRLSSFSCPSPSHSPYSLTRFVCLSVVACIALCVSLCVGVIARLCVWRRFVAAVVFNRHHCSPRLCLSLPPPLFCFVVLPSTRLTVCVGAPGCKRAKKGKTTSVS